MTFTGNSVDDTATYSCIMSFELVGSTNATCTQMNMNTATFSPVPPVCRRKWSIHMIGIYWKKLRVAGYFGVLSD